MYIVYRINNPCQLFTFSFKADGKSIGLTVAYTFQNENSKIEKKKKGFSSHKPSTFFNLFRTYAIKIQKF